MELPPTVFGLKLLHDSVISATDRKLVLMEIDFDKPLYVYKKAKAGLNKYMAESISLIEVTEA